MSPLPPRPCAPAWVLELGVCCQDVISQDPEDVSRVVAREIATLISRRATQGRPCVLGLATGSTPMHIYRELVRLHQEEGLSFANVVTFNLDEYYPMDPHSLQSYHRRGNARAAGSARLHRVPRPLLLTAEQRAAAVPARSTRVPSPWFMQEHLFAHVDIQPENTHLPSGRIPLEQVPRHCQEYEAAIQAAGGVDLQLLGLGRTGHIGFNERGSSRASATRLITLDRLLAGAAELTWRRPILCPSRGATSERSLSTFTRRSPEWMLPLTFSASTTAITMGVGTILRARSLLLVAFGENKAGAVAQAVEGPVSSQAAASFLQQHPQAQILVDYAAAAGLARVACPWVLGPIHWDATQVNKAAVWLAQQVGKPLLKLTDEDYNAHSLQDLLAEAGPAYDINLRVYYALSATITGWPGGQPPSKDRRHRIAAPGPAAKQASALPGGDAGASADSPRGEIKAGRPNDASEEESAEGSAASLLAPPCAPCAALPVWAAPDIQLQRQYTDQGERRDSWGCQEQRGEEGEAEGGAAAGAAERIAGAAAAGGGGDRQERRVFPKRVLVMSPHPDDDVISMGGTLIRLVDQGHEVHVSYQTSGNIAGRWQAQGRAAGGSCRVCGKRVGTAARQRFCGAMGLDASQAAEAARRIEGLLQAKQPGEVDGEDVLAVKALIRQCEARSAGRACGVPVERLHFLNLPFYQARRKHTGTVVKAPLSDADVQIVVDMFERVQPHLIFAAGDLSDPHGTHRAVFRALDIVHCRDWFRRCGTHVLLYRGAWQEWEPWEVDVAVPLSPGELERKVQAIWKHQSQKDRALFPGERKAARQPAGGREGGRCGEGGVGWRRPV
eukprot:scaffold2.g7017.t1